MLGGLGSTASDIATSIINAGTQIEIEKAKAKAEAARAAAEQLRLQAKQADTSIAPPMISPAVKLGLGIGIPAVALLVVAMMLKK